MIKKIYH